MGVGQMQLTVAVSAVRTADFTFESVDGSHQRLGGHFIIDVTNVNTSSVTPRIDGYDPVSGKWYNIITGTALTATGTTVLRIYPSITAAANASVADFLPPRWRFVMAHGNANNTTYSVGAYLR